MNTHRLAAALGAVLLLWVGSGSARQAPGGGAPKDTPPWAPWVEPDFPFFSSVLDARRAGAGLPADNLTPRGLVLNLGGSRWAAFDVDLLRIAAIWQGSGVTPKALAPGSYLQPDRKTPLGQGSLPEPDGEVWMANGIYAGWQAGPRPSLADPREPAPSPEEVGRGPLPDEQGRFRAIRLVRDGTVLEYTAGGAEVRERIVRAAGAEAVERHLRIGPAGQPVWLLLGYASPGRGAALCGGGGHAALERVDSRRASEPAASADPAPLWAVRVAPRQEAIDLCVSIGRAEAAPPRAGATAPSDEPPARRWTHEITTGIARSADTEPFVVDEIALPVTNPWRRNVRPGDIQFLKDGTGAVVTLDGDVWLVRGAHAPDGRARWTRFASGLHEPLTLAVRDEQLYVFDRNGIWRLRDTNGDGEADVHELFSNAFAQTADTREFPSTIRLGPDGEFVIAKGGQESATIGKHNGSVLRISADGRKATVLGYGFRQPSISVNVRTGLVLSSDQQGNYVPTTPLHIVGGRQFYGFLGDKLPREQYPAPIADALTWIPHAVNASALSQVWLFGARMGPLNDTLVHIGFNRPELFRVLFDRRAARPQAAVVSITRAFQYPPLNGSVNPADGQLYIAGLQVRGWGTTVDSLAGLGRVRYTGRPSTLPSDFSPMDKGILLRFDVALDRAKAANPDNYSVTSWQYKRTYQYGSPQFKADGSPGIDRLAPSRAYVSTDGRAVFLAVPGMKPVMQMRLGWSLATAEGTPFQHSAYFTPHVLSRFDPVAEGFGALEVDLTPRVLTSEASAPVSAEEGQRLAQLYGCMACHSTEPGVSRLGPSWKGLYGSERTYAKGVLRATADDVYLKESILEPAAKVVAGYERGEAGMPSYAGVLTESQIDSIVLYIRGLR